MSEPIRRSIEEALELRDYAAARCMVAKPWPLPDDVARLVIAARVVAFEDQGPDALKELDAASEAFADRVPWKEAP